MRYTFDDLSDEAQAYASSVYWDEIESEARRIMEEDLAEQMRNVLDQWIFDEKGHRVL